MISNTIPDLSTAVSAWQCSTIEPDIVHEYKPEYKPIPLLNVSSYNNDTNLLASPPINIGTSYQMSMEIRGEPDSDFSKSMELKSFKNSEGNTDNLDSMYAIREFIPIGLKPINNKNFLVKIDDDYKLVIDSQHLNVEKLEKVVKTYYPNNEIEIFPIANNINLLSNYISNSNSFLKNNEIDPTMFVEYFNKFDEMIGYLNIFGSSHKFTSALQSIGKFDPVKHTRLIDSSTIDNQFKSFEENKSSWPKNVLGPVMFDTTGTFINDSGFNVDCVAPYSGELLGNVDDGNYESGFYMSIDNFAESLLDFHKDYHIYFNNQFNNIIILDTHSDFIGSNERIKKMFPEIIFIAKERLGKETYEEVNKLTSDIFVNVEDVKVKLNKILHDKVIDSKLSIDEIKYLIKKYFAIDTNPEHCIKFTNIWEIISSELRVSESYVNYIKRQLPIILQDLGLNKKRLSDGIYWYGLVRKPVESLVPSGEFKKFGVEDTAIPASEFKSKLDKFLQDRDEELKSVISSYKPTFINKELQPINEVARSVPSENLKNLPLEMTSIIEFVNKSIIADAETEEEDNEPAKVEQDNQTTQSKLKQTKTKQGKPSQPKPKVTKAKKQSGEEPVSNELGKLITKSEEKPKKTIKPKANKKA